MKQLFKNIIKGTLRGFIPALLVFSISYFAAATVLTSFKKDHLIMIVPMQDAAVFMEQTKTYGDKNGG